MSDVETERLKNIRNIVLIGFSGTGKSSSAPKLAKLIGFEVFDTDRAIERQTSKVITDVHPSELKQRSYSMIDDLEEMSGRVIAVGAELGADEEWMLKVKRNSYVVWLAPTSFEFVWIRIAQSGHRRYANLPDGKQVAENDYRTWSIVYERVKDCSSVASGYPKDTARAVIQSLKRKGVYPKPLSKWSGGTSESMAA